MITKQRYHKVYNQTYQDCAKKFRIKEQELKKKIGLAFKDWFENIDNEFVDDAIFRITGVKCKKYEEN